jgi:hypothetical protein
MKRETCGLVILGIGLTAGAGLFIGGCVESNSWWAMFAIIPALLAIVCQFGLARTMDPSATTGWIGFDGWIFLLGVALTSAIGLPIVLWNVLDLDTATLVMFILAPLAIIGAFITANVLGTRTE